MPSPAHSQAPPPGNDAAALSAWADCPRCGEHWPGGAPYCSNCGWLPDSGGQMTGGPHRASGAAQHQRSATRPLLAPLAAFAALVLLSLAVWGWVGEWRIAAPPLSEPAPVATAVPIQPHAPAAATSVQQPAAPAPDPAEAAPPTQAAPADPRDPGQFVRDWLAAEADLAGGPEALRPYYADRVSYRGHTGAGWALISADKAGFMQRWPQRHYELLSLQELGPDTAGDDRANRADGPLRTALRVRWRLENRGRWQRGESVTVLTLRRIDGRWRIVAEEPAPSTPGAPATVLSARSVTVSPAR